MEIYLDNSDYIFIYDRRCYSSDKIKESKFSKKIARLENSNFLNDHYKKENYYIKKKLGSGNFGSVKLGIYIPTKEKVAIKIIEKSKLTDNSDIIRLQRELEILIKVNHPNIVRARDIFEDKDFYYIVMDYCEGDDLYNYIMKKGQLSEEESSFYFYQLINGVEYIHSLGIAHRDLKPENILLTKDHILKIIDFGLSNYFHEGQKDLLSTPCGSPCYASPEILKGIKYDGFMIDIWNCGLILFIMICGYYPFYFGNNENNDTMFKSILECNIEYPNFLSNNTVKLLKKIIVTDPKKRINIEEIKKHPFYIKGKYNFEKNYNNIFISNKIRKYEKIHWKKYKQNNYNLNSFYFNDDNIKKDQHVNTEIDTRNHIQNINLNNPGLQKYIINWKKYRNIMKKKITKNSEKNEYSQKYNLKITIQDDNNKISNEKKIIKTEVNYLNIINNKIIISPDTLNKNKKSNLRNNLHFKTKNEKMHYKLRKFKEKIIKNNKAIDKGNSKNKNNSKSQNKNEQKDKNEKIAPNKNKLMFKIEKLFYNNKRNKINNNYQNKKIYRNINSFNKYQYDRNNKTIEKNLTTTLNSAKVNIKTKGKYRNKNNILKGIKKNHLYKIQNDNNYRTIEYNKNFSSKIKNKISFTELYNSHSINSGNKLKKHFLISNITKSNKISELKKKLLKNNDIKNITKRNLIYKEKSLNKDNSLSFIPKGPSNEIAKMKKAKLVLKDNNYNEKIINTTEVIESKTIQSEDYNNNIFSKLAYNKVKYINLFSTKNKTIQGNIATNKNNRTIIIQKVYDKKGINSKFKKLKNNIITSINKNNYTNRNQFNRIISMKNYKNSLSLNINKDITISNPNKK